MTGRTWERGEREKAVRIGLAKRRARLERSMAHVANAGREPRPRDLERWAAMRADIALFEETLASLEAGGDPPPSPLTGSRTKDFPDALT